MHDGMQYDPNEGQGHKPFKIKILVIFKNSPPPFTMGAGN